MNSPPSKRMQNTCSLWLTPLKASRGALKALICAVGLRNTSWRNILSKTKRCQWLFLRIDRRFRSECLAGAVASQSMAEDVPPPSLNGFDVIRLSNVSRIVSTNNVLEGENHQCKRHGF